VVGFFQVTSSETVSSVDREVRFFDHVFRRQDAFENTPGYKYQYSYFQRKAEKTHVFVRIFLSFSFSELGCNDCIAGGMLRLRARDAKYARARFS
jgi:hypothetical protein